jgi:O-antigen ligase
MVAENLKKFFPWSLFLIGLVLVVRDQLIVPFIILSFICSIPLWKKPNPDRRFVPLFGLMLFFLWYLVGMTYSENMSYGWRDVESKLSFFLFPLLLLMTSKSWTTEHVSKVKYGLVVGVILSLMLSFGRALLCKIQGGEICFRNDQFGFNMHATYLSVMYTMSVFFVFEMKTAIKREWIFKIMYLLVIFLALYFLRSLSSFVAAVVLSTGTYIWYMITRKKWIMLSIIPILFIVGSMALEKLPAVQGEVKKTIETVEDYQKDPDDFIRRKVNWNESNTVRIVVWNFSWEIISDKPMGVGTGDVKDELYRVYRAHGYDLFAEKELNPHNQFFQTGISIGVGAMLLLLFILLAPLIFAKGSFDPVQLAFLILVFITCLFESFLERQAGIIFFAFMLITFVGQQIITKKADIKE